MHFLQTAFVGDPIGLRIADLLPIRFPVWLSVSVTHSLSEISVADRDDNYVQAEMSGLVIG